MSNNLASRSSPPQGGASVARPVSTNPLLQPLAVGRTTLPNRIVFGAHLTNFGRGNRYTERHLAYYRERAAGGAGLIVAETMTVHDLDWPYEHVPHGHTDAILPSLESLAAAIREANPATRIVAQLNHTGGQCSGRLLRQSPWAPSPITDVASKRMAREMLSEEVAEVIAGFAAAAGRVACAGLDGVELNAGQWSLIRQFLSALTNFRQDAFGGDPERRMRFLLDVVGAVRGALGTAPLLGVKLCGDELAPWGGLTPQDAETIAKRLAADGLVDYLSIEIGGPYSTHMTDAAMPVPQGHAAHLAAGVRKALQEATPGDAGHALPVFAEGRIESPTVAEQIVANGQADAVVMTRALLSDPRLPRKLAPDAFPDAQPEDTEPVRPHIGNTRYFSVRGDWNRRVGDLANPRAGREAGLPEAGPLVEARGRPVLVVGSGPAGCEAALTLARQGWAVTLIERNVRLGGWAARLGEAVAARGEYGLLAAYYAEMLKRLSVTVKLGHTLSPDDSEVGGHPLADFARIYLAVGAEPPGAMSQGKPLDVSPGSVTVLTARALLDDPPPKLSSAGRVAVVDTEYGFRMANAVEWLVAAGHPVDVVSPDFFVGRELVESGDFLWFQRVATAQINGAPAVTLRPRLNARGLRGNELVCADRFSEVETVLGRLAAVVLAQPEVPAAALYEVLATRHPAVIRIGDARAPRLMGEAIVNAHRTVVLGETR